MKTKTLHQLHAHAQRHAELLRAKLTQPSVRTIRREDAAEMECAEQIVVFLGYCREVRAGNGRLADLMVRDGILAAEAPAEGQAEKAYPMECRQRFVSATPPPSSAPLPGASPDA